MQLEIGACYETINDALRAAVMALGGFKKVGTLLRPDDVNADDWLRHCLKNDRREKLSPEQAMLILREARRLGFHSAMDFVAMDLGYKATPVDASAQRQALMETIAANQERLNQQVAMLTRMTEGAI